MKDRKKYNKTKRIKKRVMLQKTLSLCQLYSIGTKPKDFFLSLSLPFFTFVLFHVVALTKVLHSHTSFYFPILLFVHLNLLVSKLLYVRY